MKKRRIEHVTRYAYLPLNIIFYGGGGEGAKAQDTIFGRSQENKSRQLRRKRKKGRAEIILKMCIVCEVAKGT